MPDSPSGVYTLPPSYKVANGDLTDASQHNPPFEDVQQALSNRLHRDGRTPWTGDQNANNNKLTNLKDGTGPQDAATVAQLNDMGVAIGDGKWSVRDLGPNWLRRDGSLYDRADYPDLADILPDLPDGVTWESLLQGLSGEHSLVSHPDGGYALFRGYTNGSTDFTDVYRSTGGVNWDVIATITGFRARNVLYGNGIWLVFDTNGRSSTSPDLLTWSTPVAVFSYPFRPGGYAAAAFGQFWAAGSDGSSIETPKLKSSSDGQVWADVRTLPSAPLNVRFLNGRLLVMGGQGMLHDTGDGTTWETRSTGTTSVIFDALYANSLYVAFGGGGTIITSPTLSAWTPRASGTTRDLLAGAYSSSGFMLVGKQGAAVISAPSSGTSWTVSATGLNAELRGIVVEDGRPNSYLVSTGSTPAIVRGLRTTPTQFRVPNDDPTYGWIRAL